MFLDHTTTQHSRQDSSGRVISSSQRPLPDKTQHSQQKISMPSVGFEPTISAGDPPQTYALDGAATGTGNTKCLAALIQVCERVVVGQSSCYSDSLRAEWSRFRILVEAGFFVNFHTGPESHPISKISTVSSPHTFRAAFGNGFDLYLGLHCVQSQTCQDHGLTFTACIVLFMSLQLTGLLSNNTYYSLFLLFQLMYTFTHFKNTNSH